MEKAKPIISVVIPTHNRLDLLEKAVHSIYAQTLMPHELIVVDDGSNPGITEHIFDDAPEALKTILIRHDSPMGAPEARNTGITKASGSWIAFLDDDDSFFAEKVEAVSRCITNNPDSDVIYHPARINMVGLNVSYYNKPQSINPVDNAFELIYSKNIIGGTSMAVVKKAIMLNVGMFSNQMPALQDMELWLKLAKANAHFYLLNEVLTDYYFYPEKKSITKNIESRKQALAIIKSKYSSELIEISNKETQQGSLKSNVFIALINMQTKTAFYQQLKLFRKTLRFKDFALLLLIPLGPRWVFKVRSFL
jgi:glycosyltransferase involved in cell wall biosynthesis